MAIHMNINALCIEGLDIGLLMAYYSTDGIRIFAIPEAEYNKHTIVFK